VGVPGVETPLSPETFVKIGKKKYKFRGFTPPFRIKIHSGTSLFKNSWIRPWGLSKLFPSQ